MAVRLIGDPLSAEQQQRIQHEIYGENDGDTLGIGNLIDGLVTASSLITQEVVDHEISHAAYVAKC